MFKDWRLWIVAVCGLLLAGNILAALWIVGKGPGLILINATLGAVAFIILKALWKESRPEHGG